jgi:hypothetical protein
MMVTDVLDLKKRYAHLYKPSSKEPVLVDVPPLRSLMIDGAGAPGGPEFREAMGALYGLAYPVKFSAKKELDLSYPVMASEGLCWDATAGPLVPPESPEETAWRLMIMLPDEVSAEFVQAVSDAVSRKKSVPRLGDVYVRTFSEGMAVQIMHVGPYSDEPATVQRLLTFVAEKRLEIAGAHHEIYLGDPNKAAPDKLKTVIRYAVRQTKQSSTPVPPARKAAATQSTCSAARSPKGGSCAAPGGSARRGRGGSRSGSRG